MIRTTPKLTLAGVNYGSSSAGRPRELTAANLLVEREGSDL